MANILLTTLNARYIHAAFGLRYLRANLGDLRPDSAILEFDLQQRPVDVAESILSRDPTIVGIGVYIWNVAQATELVRILKRVRPQLTVVLGGPEVSFECDQQAIVAAADYVITGEADLEFARLCRELVKGVRPAQKIIAAPLPEMSELQLPYHEYTPEDVAHRVLYVEASRGCPFTCEFCLSSLDIPVRQVDLAVFLAALERLLDQGARQFKFVDRTFNLNVPTGMAILQFFLDRYRPGLFLHFEMIPDRLPEPLRELIMRFPPGVLQFEVGIQSFNPEVCSNIRRRQNFARLEDNFTFLTQRTGVHIHADLIAGLPGESIESFAAGFDRLIALNPHEIQVGILKRLRGTSISRHDREWEMVYREDPPYEVLQTKLLPFNTVQRLRRFARYWDIVANSGNFIESTPLLWADGSSPFSAFMTWSDWLFEHTARTHALALNEVARSLFDYLTGQKQLVPGKVAEVIWRDYQRSGHYERPQFLAEFVPPIPRPIRAAGAEEVSGPPRQARHWTHRPG